MNYKKFLNDERIRVIVAHPKSGGIGLDFIVANVCIFYSLDDDLEARIQAEERLHRIGMDIKRGVSYYFLLCPNTVDTKIFKTHENGLSLMDVINNKNFKSAMRGE